MTHLNVYGDNGRHGVRRHVPDAELYDMIATELTFRIANEECFTAYDITVALRQDNPGYDIEHGGRVRELVHTGMLPLRAQGLYDWRTVPKGANGELAQEYYPTITRSNAPSLNG